VTDELVKALLVEDAASARDIALALHASVSRGVPLVRALLETRAVSEDALGRVLARSEAPELGRVVPAMDVVALLPQGMCERLHAVPVRRDPVTGTVDLALADAGDAHAAAEFVHHLGAAVRVLRAPLLAMEEGLRRVLGITSRPPERAPDAARRAEDDLAPPTPRRAVLVVADDDDDRTSQLPPFAHGALSRSLSPPSASAPRRARDTPPWGTEIPKSAQSDPPKSGMGSEIPIPLMRRTFTAVAGGTQRPPPLVDPRVSPLGEGYAYDAGGLVDVVELGGGLPAIPLAIPPAAAPLPRPAAGIPSTVAQPAPAPVSEPAPATERTYDRLRLEAGAEARARVQAAMSRDEVLDALLAGAKRVAGRVALFVVRRGGYLGWTCTPSFADRADMQTLLLPLDTGNVLDRTVQDGFWLGPVPRDAVHAPLWAVMRRATSDVAVVPVRVRDRAAVLVLADELVDTMLATKLLEELAADAGDAFTRILRNRG
jgi:hypothetical protein